MSRDLTNYIILGVELDERHNVNSDKLLPYIEGHRGVEFRIIQQEIANPPGYKIFGIILSEIEENQDVCKRFNLNITKQLNKLKKELNKLGIDIHMDKYGLFHINNYL